MGLRKDKDRAPFARPDAHKPRPLMTRETGIDTEDIIVFDVRPFDEASGNTIDKFKFVRLQGI